MRPRVSRGGKRTHQDPRDAEAERQTREYFEKEVATWQIPAFTKNVSIHVCFWRATMQIVDLDNLVKHFLDSANGVLFSDDALVTRLVAELELDRECPRTWWSIRSHRTSTMIRERPFKDLK